MKKYLFEIILFFSMLLMWLIPFALIHFKCNYIIFESVFLILIGIIIGLQLVFMKNTFYSLQIILFVPFIFSHPIDAYSIPNALFVAVIFAISGIIIHMVRFKVKIKLHKLSIGFLLLSLALLFGGITSKNDYLLMQFVVLLFAIVGFLFIILFFTSTIENVSFAKICNLIILFSIFIQLQGYISLPFNANFDISMINGRMVDVGWGICNNIDLILSTTLPFSLYFVFKYKTFNKNIALALIFPLITLSSIIIFKSKGCIIFSSFIILVTYLTLIIYLYKTKQNDKAKKTILTSISYLICFIIFLLIVDLFIPVWSNFDSTFSSFNLATLNGRVKIYIESLKSLKGNILFGNGMFAGFTYKDTNNILVYTWCHNSILQVLYSCGIIGLLLFGYHLFEKYYYLIKNCSIEKIVILISFIVSGLYGLIDVSYFFINYMILYIIITILCNFIYEDTQYKLKKQLEVGEINYESC